MLCLQVDNFIPMCSGGHKQKSGEELDKSDPVPPSKFYPPKQIASRRVVEEPTYDIERVVNDTDTITCWASKTKACIVYPSCGDLPPRFPTACWVHRTKSQDTKYHPFKVGKEELPINQFDDGETSSEQNA